jgi:hypothetical protein
MRFATARTGIARRVLRARPPSKGDGPLGLDQVRLVRRRRDQHQIGASDGNCRSLVTEAGGVHDQHRVLLGNGRQQLRQTLGVCLSIGLDFLAFVRLEGPTVRGAVCVSVEQSNVGGVFGRGCNPERSPCRRRPSVLQAIV